MSKVPQFRCPNRPILDAQFDDVIEYDRHCWHQAKQETFNGGPGRGLRTTYTTCCFCGQTDVVKEKLVKNPSHGNYLPQYVWSKEQ